MLKITAYADRLLNDLDKLDWPEKVKKMQADWIGKSYGAEVEFPVDGRDEKITVYTTRPDTLYGATFMVLAPEHEMAASLATDETREAVEKYIYDASMKSNVDRLQDKEKTGVFTGSYAINPLSGLGHGPIKETWHTSYPHTSKEKFLCRLPPVTPPFP